MNAIDKAFVQKHALAFEDFWNRRRDSMNRASRSENSESDSLDFHFPAFGYDVHLQTNAREVLDAARLSAPRYCLSNSLESNSAMSIKIAVVPNWQAPAVPSNLPACIQTVGTGDYLFQAATPWLQWFVDLRTRVCHGFVSPSLAAEPRLVSRYLLDRAVTNILSHDDTPYLHATSLVHDDHALLFIAPHGTGKSTTAFHLLRAGYRLMGDGLLFVREHNDTFELMGYPVGEAKLMPQMQSLFPEWRGEGDEVSVHNIVKRIVNLRDLAPDKLVEHSVFPERVILCLAARDGNTVTHAERLTTEAAMERVLPDTIHWDEPARMVHPLNVLRRLIERAACYRLTLGSNREELVDTIVALARSE